VASRVVGGLLFYSRFFPFWGCLFFVGAVCCCGPPRPRVRKEGVRKAGVRKERRSPWCCCCFPSAFARANALRREDTEVVSFIFSSSAVKRVAARSPWTVKRYCFVKFTKMHSATGCGRRFIFKFLLLILWACVAIVWKARTTCKTHKGGLWSFISKNAVLKARSRSSPLRGQLRGMSRRRVSWRSTMPPSLSEVDVADDDEDDEDDADDEDEDEDEELGERSRLRCLRDFLRLSFPFGFFCCFSVRRFLGGGACASSSDSTLSVVCSSSETCVSSSSSSSSTSASTPGGVQMCSASSALVLKFFSHRAHRGGAIFFFLKKIN
ncbi:membrane-associated protein, putative, partial [Bodo saltans]